jgi:hypothetical protein
MSAGLPAASMASLPSSGELESQLLADLIESVDMGAGLFEMALNRFDKAGARGRLRHLGKGFDELIFRVEKILELIFKQAGECFKLHGS